MMSYETWRISYQSTEQAAKSAYNSLQRECTMNEEEQEREFQVGKSAGLKQAAERLMQAALDSYRRGRDDEAKLLREQAKHLKARADEAHPGPPPDDEPVEDNCSVIEEPLCEIRNIIPRPNQLYRFVAMPGCDQCKKFDVYSSNEETAENKANGGS